MSESAPNPHVPQEAAPDTVESTEQVFELPHNTSIVELPGDMIPDMTPQTGYNSYRNSIDGQFYYQIFENEKSNLSLLN
jgi:hypothetical protein